MSSQVLNFTFSTGRSEGRSFAESSNHGPTSPREHYREL